MPFWAKCLNCGHIVFAPTRRLLNEFMRSHNAKSHGLFDDEFMTWKIYTITYRRYQEICVASRSPAFWNMVRKLGRLL
ncbi:MAG: hypothetical protein QW660_03580 [Candidatus Bathyarchaeia archaeon]